MKAVLIKQIKRTIAVGLLATLASCQLGPSTTIVSNDGHNYLKVEYRGRIAFNEKRNGIEDISRGGFLRYEHNGHRFEAEHGSHGVEYAFNGDDKVNRLNPEQQNLVADAVHEIIKQQAQAKRP